MGMAQDPGTYDPFALMGSSQPEFSQEPNPYDPFGARVGSFLVYPSVASGYFYDSNVYATNEDEVSGNGILTSPRLLIESDWNRHAVRVDLAGADYRYFGESEANRTDYWLDTQAQIDVRADFALLATATAARRHEELGTTDSPEDAAEPVPYDSYKAGLAFIKSFNRLSVGVGARTEFYDYDDVQSLDGDPIDQDFRDGHTHEIGGRVSYLLLPGHRVFADARVNQRQHTESDFDDSLGLNTTIGVEFVLTSLLRGEAGVGYLVQDYEDPDQETASGFSYNGNLIWSATPLMTLTVSGKRAVSDSAEPDTGSRIQSTFLAVLDYELRRNLLLKPRFEVVADDFVDTSRHDLAYSPGIGITYLLNRHVGFGVDYDFTEHGSSDPENEYTRHRVSAYAKAQF